jgi:hypothetical protein
MICTKVADFLDKIMRQNKESEAPNVSLIAPVSASPAKFWGRANLRFPSGALFLDRPQLTPIGQAKGSLLAQNVVLERSNGRVQLSSK